MNSDSKNNINNNPKNKTFSDSQKRILSYQNLIPSFSYGMQNQNNQKKIQFFPIATKESLNGTHTIYLAAEDNNIDEEDIANHVYKYNYPKKR